MTSYLDGLDQVAAHDRDHRRRARKAARDAAHLGFMAARYAALRAMGYANPRKAPETVRQIAGAYALTAVDAIDDAATAAASQHTLL